jgi:hypothetical protein
MRLLWLVVGGGLVLSFAQVRCTGQRDLRWRAMEAVFDGHLTTTADPTPTLLAARALAQDPSARIYTPEKTVGAAFIYPPLAAALYHPIANQPEPKAAQSLILANRILFLLIGLCAALLAFRSRFRVTSVFVLALALLFFHPLTRALELNQATIPVTSLIGLAWVTRRRSAVVAGMAWALAVAIKPQLILALPILWWSERRFVLSTLACGVVLLAASFGYAGWQNHSDYVTRMLPAVASGYAFYPNQSWNGFFNRLLIDMPINRFAIAPPNGTVRMLSSLMAALMYGGALLVAWRTRRSLGAPRHGLLFGFAWLAATLASPIAWEHHFAPAVFLFAEAYAAYEDGWRPSQPLLIVFVMGGTLVASYFELRTAHELWEILLASYVFYGALILFGTLAITLLHDRLHDRRAQPLSEPA